MRVKCRSPLCDRELMSNNRTGFCWRCQRGGPGRRWFQQSNEKRRTQIAEAQRRFRRSPKYVARRALADALARFIAAAGRANA